MAEAHILNENFDAATGQFLIFDYNLDVWGVCTS
jgi:hypothetical protein